MAESHVYRTPSWALMTPDQIAELADSLDNTSKIDLYTARYETHFKGQGMPDAEAKSRAQFWAQLKTTMPEGSVIDPDLSVDDMLMQHRLKGAGTVEPSSIIAAAVGQPRAALTVTGGPPSAVEPPPSYFFPISNGITLDRYSLNPGADFYRRLLTGSNFVGSPPEMFGSGPLPVVTASGIDSSALRWVPWFYRHTAALAESRALVVTIIEHGLSGTIDPVQLQTADGRALWQAYYSRLQEWVQAVPLDERPHMLQEQVDRLYGPGPDDGQ